MFIPQTYWVALVLMLLSMLCWGSWANAQKIDKGWRFELFYWDYMWGLLAMAAVFGLTLGNTHPGSPHSFFQNLSHASTRSLLEALAGGAIFNLGNLLMVAAIAVAGMAIAFPIGAGLALVIGAAINYIISPSGNPVLLFGGIGLVCLAIVLDALAYRAHQGSGNSGKKGIVLSLACGVAVGLFYPFVAKALQGPGHLQPYTVYFVFALGATVANFPMNYVMMRRPVTGDPLRMRDYLRGSLRVHVWGWLGGAVWGVGTICSFVASYVSIVGPATSFSLGEGNTMISAVWGIFVWGEFDGSSKRVKVLLGLMFLFFVAGLTSIALAPVIR